MLFDHFLQEIFDLISVFELFADEAAVRTSSFQAIAKQPKR
jgi:hypothetical protein